MKVVHLVSTFAKRGAELFANSLANEMKNADCKVYVVAIANNLEDQIVQYEGINYLCMSKKGPSYGNFLAFIKLAFFLKKLNAKFVIAHGIYPLTAVSLFQFMFPRTMIVYRNMSVHSGSGPKSLKKMLNRFSMKNADLSVFPSYKSKDEILSSYSLKDLKVAIIPRGVDYSALLIDEARKDIVRELQLHADEKLVVHIAAFEPVKNHLGLISIAKKVRAQNRKIRFVLIGDGYLRKKIEQQLPEGVTSLGYRDDAEKFIAAADAVVLTSHAEGFGAVLAEASAYGVPTVAYDVGGVGTIVKDGINGSLVPYNDEVGFVNALLSTLNMSIEEHELISQNAKNLFTNEFSMEVCSQRYLNHMKAMLQEPL